MMNRWVRTYSLLRDHRRIEREVRCDSTTDDRLAWAEVELWVIQSSFLGGADDPGV
jgi:hypothetical protein